MDLRAWDRRHQEESAEPRAPALLVERIASGLAPGRALDLACGTGRNALWLAGQGWDVTAVDGSRAAITTLRERIAERRNPGSAGTHLRIEAIVADLEKHEFAIEPGRWDLIVMHLYLQRDLFEALKRGMAPGGVVIAVALLEDGGHRRYRVSPGELRSYFGGWTMLHDREGSADTHPVAEIAAQRPGVEPIPQKGVAALVPREKQ